MKPELAAKVKRADDEITRLCRTGGKSWHVGSSALVENNDSDVLLIDAITALVGEVKQLEARLKALEPKPVNYLDNPARERKYF